MWGINHALALARPATLIGPAWYVLNKHELVLFVCKEGSHVVAFF